MFYLRDTEAALIRLSGVMSHGPILQTIDDLMMEIMWIFVFNLDLYDPISNNFAPSVPAAQLSCNEKIVTWFDNYSSFNSRINL